MITLSFEFEYTDTRTYRLMSNLKNKGRQERQGTELRKHDISHQPQTLHPHSYVLNSSRV